MKQISHLLTLCCLCFISVPVLGQNSAMSFNIRYDNPDDGMNAWSNRKEEVVELIGKFHPDFIGIQEALPNQVNYISENLDGYEFIGHGRDGVNTDSEATPIFYNSEMFELVDQKIFWLSDTPDKISRGWDAALNRISVYGKFRNKKTEEVFHIINTHFDHQGETARLRSADLLTDFIRQQQLANEKIVLMGDLNATPDDPPIMALRKDLQDAGENENLKGTFTGFNTEVPATNRIDYIFVKNLEVKKYQCIDLKRKNGLYPSDHFPVYIEF